LEQGPPEGHSDKLKRRAGAADGLGLCALGCLVFKIRLGSQTRKIEA